MTVPTYRSREDYTGNGVTTSYPYQFRIYKATDLVVTHATPDGVETTLVLNTDYTVTGVGKYAGGNVVLTSALTSGYHLTIERALPVTQETDLRNQGAYFAETHEDVFDRLVMILQHLFGTVARSLKFPLSDGEVNSTLPSRDSRKGRVLAFHETTGDPVKGPSVAAMSTVSGALVAIQTVADDLNEPVSEIETVAQNMETINAAYATSLAAIANAEYLRTYMDQVVANITFPLDLGLITDPVLYNHFDLGAL